MSDIDDKTQNNLIYKAIAEGDITRVRQLLQHDSEIVKARDEKGMTPLHKAAATQGDHADLVHLLISYGADIEAKDNDGWTPLDWADFWINRDVILLLSGLCL